MQYLTLLMIRQYADESVMASRFGWRHVLLTWIIVVFVVEVLTLLDVLPMHFVYEAWLRFRRLETTKEAPGAKPKFELAPRSWLRSLTEMFRSLFFGSWGSHLHAHAQT